MGKTIRFLTIFVITGGILASSWIFFRKNMAIHPLVKACYLSLLETLPSDEVPALLGAKFVMGDNGATVLLTCTKGPFQSAKLESKTIAPPTSTGKLQGIIQSTEYIFPLRQDPKRPMDNRGGNPFEDDSLIITEYSVSGQQTVPLLKSIHGIITPLGMHRPIGTITKYTHGLPVGHQSSTTYNRINHFFRYDDQVVP